jgi:hypothetical protein
MICHCLSSDTIGVILIVLGAIGAGIALYSATR